MKVQNMMLKIILKKSDNMFLIKLGNINVTNRLRNSLKQIIWNNTNRLQADCRAGDINVKNVNTNSPKLII